MANDFSSVLCAYSLFRMYFEFIYFFLSDPKWLLRNEWANGEIFYECWQRPFQTLHCSLLLMLAFDIDHLPPCTYPINESENLYVNTIGKLLLFIFFSHSRLEYKKKSRNIKLLPFLLGFKRIFQAPFVPICFCCVLSSFLYIPYIKNQEHKSSSGKNLFWKLL